MKTTTTMATTPSSLQRLLQQMLEERGADTLPEDRQAYYLRRARQEFKLLGLRNPFTVDPTAELQAFKRLEAEVDTSGYW